MMLCFRQCRNALSRKPRKPQRTGRRFLSTMNFLCRNGRPGEEPCRRRLKVKTRRGTVNNPPPFSAFF
nr:MAG TPA: hypothetical protein [Caudoviricetes sp.]DAR09177.1 MAG TPA: hypothetical protein [Caudoviricetes sp.]